jgi:hypothetical protein
MRCENCNYKIYDNIICRLIGFTMMIKIKDLREQQ